MGGPPTFGGIEVVPRPYHSLSVYGDLISNVDTLRHISGSYGVNIGVQNWDNYGDTYDVTIVEPISLNADLSMNAGKIKVARNDNTYDPSTGKLTDQKVITEYASYDPSTMKLLVEVDTDNDGTVDLSNEVPVADIVQRGGQPGETDYPGFCEYHGGDYCTGQ